MQPAKGPFRFVSVKRIKKRLTDYNAEVLRKTNGGMLNLIRVDETRSAKDQTVPFLAIVII